MSAWWAGRLAPPSPPGRGGRDLPLEGLRGLCACLVLYAHMTMPLPRLDPAYAPSGRFWWFNLGSAAVLFFFVLSGYVIGLSVRGPFSGPEARRYLGRRLIRLVPVNTAAVLLGWMLLPRLPIGTVLGNLGFLESFRPLPLLGWQVEVMPDNLNLWSLNFEALYYLAFLAVWRLAPRAVFAVCAVGAVAAAAFAGGHAVAASYAFGALFWMAGLSVAWLAAGGTGPGNWPSAILAVVAICRLSPLGHFLRLAHIPNTVEPLPIPTLHLLDLLPPMAWLLLAVTGRGGGFVRWLGASCLAWASAGLALAFHAGEGGEAGAMACYAAAVALGWALFRWKPKPSALALLAPLGAVSYGVYAVGFPIQFGIFSSHWIPEGSAVTYAFRAALLAGTTFGLAWILERKLQPALRRALGGGRPPGAIGSRERPN